MFDFRALTRALLGFWIFHRLLGGGVERPPPPMISAPGRRREKQKAAVAQENIVKIPLTYCKATE